MARLYGSKGRVVDDATAKSSSHKETTPIQQLHNQNEVLKELLPVLIAMQQKHHIMKFLMNF